MARMLLAVLFTLSAAIKDHGSDEVHGIGETIDALGGGMSSKHLPKITDAVKNFEFTFQFPSFLVGLAAGVLCTVLMVGILTDRLAHTMKAEASSSSLTGIDQDPEQEVPSTSNEETSAGKHHESLHLFWPRCGWLISMLLVQSISSLILSAFSGLLQNHMDLAFFLTMLVGLGGNAGGQSVVLTVRRLAMGKDTRVSEQVLVGLQLALILSPLAFMRALVQQTPWRDSCTIGLAAAIITVTATCLGASLPKLLWILDVDPAHASVAVQVLMDITGIAIVCMLGYLIIEVL